MSLVYVDNIKPVQSGGTGATSASGARTNIGISGQLGWFNNLAIVRATTTNAGDSIKITSADGTALSSTNSGIIRLMGTTAGQTTEFTVTSDVTILLTGAHWGVGTTGDLTGALLRVLAINDNGTLKWGVAYLGGRYTLLTTDTTATQSSVTLPEYVLCSSAVSSSTNTCREIGFVRADFDDTGGAAEDLWAIQSGINDVVTGQSADGLWQPWNIVYGGFSANPTALGSRWTQNGRNITVIHRKNANGTSNATSFTVTLPAKAYGTNMNSFVGANEITNNGVAVANSGQVVVTANSTTANLYIDAFGSGWIAANAKGASFSIKYEVGPSTSFIE